MNPKRQPHATTAEVWDPAAKRMRTIRLNATAKTYLSGCPACGVFPAAGALHFRDCPKWTPTTGVR